MNHVLCQHGGRHKIPGIPPPRTLEIPHQPLTPACHPARKSRSAGRFFPAGALGTVRMTAGTPARHRSGRTPRPRTARVFSNPKEILRRPPAPRSPPVWDARTPRRPATVPFQDTRFPEMGHGTPKNPVGRVKKSIGRRQHMVGRRIHLVGRRHHTLGRRVLSIGRRQPPVGRRIVSLSEAPERPAAGSGGVGPVAHGVGTAAQGAEVVPWGADVRAPTHPRLRVVRAGRGPGRVGVRGGRDLIL